MEAAPKLNPEGAAGRPASSPGDEDRRKGSPSGSGPRPIAGGRA